MDMCAQEIKLLIFIDAQDNIVLLVVSRSAGEHRHVHGPGSMDMTEASSNRAPAWITAPVPPRKVFEPEARIRTV
jgi:hypothetical protein